MEIQGYPNYLIYPDGRVSPRRFPDRIVKVGRDMMGYKTIQIDGKTYKIHILVGQHFLPNPYNKPHIRHKNKCIQNNNVDNLEWVDSSYTNQYTRRVKNKTHDYKNISYLKKDKNYQYKKIINHITYSKHFKTLKEALCYKYIFILKMRAGLV